MGPDSRLSDRAGQLGKWELGVGSWEWGVGSWELGVGTRDSELGTDSVPAT